MLLNALGDGMCMHDILQHEDGSRVQPAIMPSCKMDNAFAIPAAHSPYQANYMLVRVHVHIQKMPCHAVRAALGMVPTCGAVGLLMVAPEAEGGPETTGRFLFFF